MQEEEDARRTIATAGGELIELSAGERRAFAAAVAPQLEEARATYGRELFELAAATPR